MKYAKDIKKRETDLTEHERKIFQTCYEELKLLMSFGKMNEELVQKLGNVITQLQAIREGYIWRIIRASKQNHMLD